MNAVVTDVRSENDAGVRGYDDEQGVGSEGARGGRSDLSLLDMLLKFLATKEDVANVKTQMANMEGRIVKEVGRLDRRVDRVEDRLGRIERLLRWVLGIVSSLAVGVLVEAINGWFSMGG